MAGDVNRSTRMQYHDLIEKKGHSHFNQYQHPPIITVGVAESVEISMAPNECRRSVLEFKVALRPAPTKMTQVDSVHAESAIWTVRRPVRGPGLTLACVGIRLLYLTDLRRSSPAEGWMLQVSKLSVKCQDLLHMKRSIQFMIWR